MIAIYTANLAAFLTVSRLDTPIETLDDLAKQFKTKYAPMEGSGSQVYFQRMADIENRFYRFLACISYFTIKILLNFRKYMERKW